MYCVKNRNTITAVPKMKGPMWARRMYFQRSNGLEEKWKAGI
jgi:hypothetical protein